MMASFESVADPADRIDRIRERPRVVLLNPPGRRLYLRDYFCSKVSQADYINAPIDFIYLSGQLKDSCELFLVDAIVERLGVSDCLTQVERLQPDAVVGLIGSVSYAEDVPFYEQLTHRLEQVSISEKGSGTQAELILIGDVLIERRRERLQELPFVNAFLHDFSTSDLANYLGLNHAPPPIQNMTLRLSGVAHAAPIVRARSESMSLPIPKHSLFLDNSYRYPFVRESRFATLMTEFGCPYRCNFCIMSTLGWKIRPVENVLQELDHLSQQGVRELFFLDQTFGIQQERTRLLLSEMSERGYDFGWVCFSRPDVVDRELATLMKKAGCHTVILGMESGSEEILETSKKDYTKGEVLEGFRRCAEQGLETVATVILGLPTETPETFRETMTFLQQLDPDFASFNVAVPRMGTPLRQKALALGLISDDLEIMDQSGSDVAMPTMTLNKSEVAAIKQKAIGSFYLNFRYLRKRLKRARSLKETQIQLGQGISLLRAYLGHG